MRELTLEDTKSGKPLVDMPRAGRSAPDELIAEVLDLSAQVIELRGWTQGQYEKADGRVCAAGAICLVTRGASRGPGTEVATRDAHDNGYNLCNQILAVVRQDAGLDVVTWNDRRGRKKGDVLRKFRKIARLKRGAKR